MVGRRALRFQQLAVCPSLPGLNTAPPCVRSRIRWRLQLRPLLWAQISWAELSTTPVSPEAPSSESIAWGGSTRDLKGAELMAEFFLAGGRDPSVNSLWDTETRRGGHCLSAGPGSLHCRPPTVQGGDATNSAFFRRRPIRREFWNFPAGLLLFLPLGLCDLLGTRCLVQTSTLDNCTHPGSRDDSTDRGEGDCLLCLDRCTWWGDCWELGLSTETEAHMLSVSLLQLTLQLSTQPCCRLVFCWAPWSSSLAYSPRYQCTL